MAVVEAGDSTAEHFSVIGDGWDAEARARALLDRLGLGHVTLDRRVGELSGGESVLLAQAALVIQRPGVLLLDEPTSNLELRARHLVYDAVEAWRRVMVIVSHDRELLERMDTTVEFYRGRARSFGGHHQRLRGGHPDGAGTARRAVTTAGSDLRRQRRDLAEARIKLDRRRRYGHKMWRTSGNRRW